jgi:DNA ligase D
VRQVDGIAVRLSSPDRPIFPGVAKSEVLDYYLAVADPLLGQIAGRPTALERWPDGVVEGAEHFYGKHLPKTVPEHVHGIRIRFPSGRPGVLFCPDSPAALAWAVQMGAVTFHAWPVTAPDVEHPDQLRIDLDPSPANSFDDIVRVALAAKEVLDEWGCTSFVKTSGSRGLHLFVPIHAQWSFVDVRHAAIAVGRELERRHPDLITMSWWKEERGDRVFVDFNQNAQDRLMASAYSLRPLPHAPVSMPIAWDQVESVDPAAFTLRTVPTLVTERSVDPWAGIRAAATSLSPLLDAWQRDIEAGLPELPYPPDFPKMPGEPPRVQPSRARGTSQ